ncbi:AraC family transcriptional regulator [Aquibium sp. LZ166]|uniref:AraC family transcriptional regulator n=1 Tax=Aquibium pacificus TaxID=3153579 RepID=A0ABV3SCK3_9HYPH
MKDDSVLLLKFQTPGTSPEARKRLSWRGFSVEHTSISDPTPYSFEVSGERHYLALHDLVLDEGEMKVDGLAPIEGRDLRNRLTYMPRHCRATGFAVPRARENSFTTLYFDPEIISAETERLYGNDGVPMIYFDDRRLRSTLQKLRTIATARESAANDLDDVYAETLGLLAVIELAQLQAKGGRSEDSPRPGLSDAQRNRVLDYIEANLVSDLNLDALAAVAKLSRFHFAREFKACVGVPPYAYVLQRRIEMARHLLKTTRLPIAEIAAGSGFRTASHFVGAFQKATGTTPTDFRRS